MNDTPGMKRAPAGSRPCASCQKNHTRPGAFCDECSGTLARTRSERHNERRADLHTPEWRRVRAAVITRDHKTCVTCGSSASLTVHHLNHEAGDHRPDNLVTLCNACHASIESEYARKQFGVWHRRLAEHLYNSPHH